MSQVRQILLQYGTDPSNYTFEDADGCVAFTVSKAVPSPNVVVKISRQEDWAARHAEIMGPSNAYLYFGPYNSPGQVAYGNAQRVAMAHYLRQRSNSSSSRYFNAQNGREYKWKSISSSRMELWDSRALLAVWERAHPPQDEHDACVTLSDTGLAIVTEVLTTLTLNLVAKQLAFW